MVGVTLTVNDQPHQLCRNNTRENHFVIHSIIPHNVAVNARSSAPKRKTNMGAGASKPKATNTASRALPVEGGGGCPVKHQGNAAAVAAVSTGATNSATTTSETTTENQPDASIATPSSKCPMHNKEDGSYTYDWWALFRPNFPHKPGGTSPLSPEQQQQQQAQRSKITRRASILDGTLASPGGGCPVKTEYNVYAQLLDPKNNMPRMANQLPAAQQSKALSTQRVSSSIPKGGADEGTTWTYPSPQMFYNSLARKNKLGDTTEDEIDSVVALHNNMNEKTWNRVVEWEAVLSGKKDSPPKLLKFMGRPTDLSPKAALKHYILGHPLPYDRHDWTILRDDGTTVRYVIDYYHDESRASDDAASAAPHMHDETATPSLLVDVRPALDGPTQLWNRVVTMPAAQWTHQTAYQYLPLRPTAAMQSQVQESVSVWASIQAAAAGKATSKDGDDSSLTLSRAQAENLVADMVKAIKNCPAQQKRLNACTTDDDCAKASLDYTLCMAQTLCPLQRAAFTKALQDDDAEHADAKIESALEVVQKCVVRKTSQRNQARQDYGI